MTNVYSLVQDEASVFMIGDLADFPEMKGQLAHHLLRTIPKNHGKWQQLDISSSDAHKTWELLNTTLWMPLAPDPLDADDFIKPDHPWAIQHFYERVCGYPINPGREYKNWPYHGKRGLELHLRATDGTEGIYDHNYMERYWPTTLFPDRRGYRFPIGDLNDVVELLNRDQGTRQAYLPVWFPEDTGAVENQRVPCSLGYHFIIRNKVLHCTYYLRSCEIYRHFTNDVYLTQMLALWIRNKLDYVVNMGQLTMHITSLHGFVGDADKIEAMI